MHMNFYLKGLTVVVVVVVVNLLFFLFSLLLFLFKQICVLGLSSLLWHIVFLRL